MQNYENIIREIFPFEEMAEYLSNRILDNEDVAEAIACAPISLKRKLEIFTSLAEEDDFFNEGAEWLKGLIGEMELKQGEILLLVCYDNDEPFVCMGSHLRPFLKWEHLFEYIEEHLKDRYDSVNITVEKWEPDENGRMTDPTFFVIINGEVCYGDSDKLSEEPIYFHWMNGMAYFPIPFHAGDIVTVDCRPFAPISHVVITDIGDNFDCCCVQAMYREDDGTYDVGALKHGFIFPNKYRHCGYSPLYRLESYKGELSEDERMLGEVSRYIDGSEERGRELWSYIVRSSSFEERETKTEAQILEFIERKKYTDNGN